MMNKTCINGVFSIIAVALFMWIIFPGCRKTENPIKYPKGTFPDSVFNISNINSQYDDYNIALYQIAQTVPFIFSSNRKSSGGQFDLEQASISYQFDQKTGVFGFGDMMTSDPFYEKLITKAVTAGNDFGPYRLFSTVDGFEYTILSSANSSGNLDFFYLKNEPQAGSTVPDISGPYPVKLMNTNSDDAYMCFNQAQDTAYFSSNKDGNFDIFYLVRPSETPISTWFNMDYTVPLKTDSINSTGADKCPFILKKVMIFASDRPGGLGGFDLYYSVLRNGKWSSPVNMGPRINSSYDEYRPVLGSNQDFTNKFLMFSSNRPGGKGGFDLYFTGVDLP